MDREKLTPGETMGSTMKPTVDEAFDSAQRLTEKAGETLASVGESLRQRLPESGGFGEAAEKVYRGVQQTAGYLQDEGVGGVVEDIEVLIRRYPIQTLFLGMGCGYLLSRLRPD